MTVTPYLCYWGSTPVDEETSVCEVPSCAVVWYWLSKVLTAVTIQEHTS